MAKDATEGGQDGTAGGAQEGNTEHEGETEVTEVQK
jgi:hypothetical protein